MRGNDGVFIGSVQLDLGRIELAVTVERPIGLDLQIQVIGRGVQACLVGELFDIHRHLGGKRNIEPGLDELRQVAILELVIPGLERQFLGPDLPVAAVDGKLEDKGGSDDRILLAGDLDHVKAGGGLDDGARLDFIRPAGSARRRLGQRKARLADNVSGRRLVFF